MIERPEPDVPTQYTLLIRCGCSVAKWSDLVVLWSEFDLLRENGLIYHQKVLFWSFQQCKTFRAHDLVLSSFNYSSGRTLASLFQITIYIARNKLLWSIFARFFLDWMLSWLTEFKINILFKVLFSGQIGPKNVLFCSKRWSEKGTILETVGTTWHLATLGWVSLYNMSVKTR